MIPEAGNDSRRLLDKVRESIRRWRLVLPGELVLAGVSGGPDSVFLMHALHRILPALPARLHILHLNHGLRGKESEEDAAFVAGAVAALGLPSTVECRPVREAAGAGFGPQEKARRVRMAFFRELKNRLGGDRIALGHTADDQMETILMRLIAGGGPGSLGGIRPLGTGGIIHPLLDIRKEDLLFFLREQGIAFRIDRTNLEERYLRNRIRHRVMPALLDLNPSLQRRMAETATLLGDDDDRLQSEARAMAGNIARAPDGSVSLDLERIAALDPSLQRRVIVLAARRAGVPPRALRQRQVEAVRGLVEGAGRSVTLAGGREAVRESRALIIRTVAPAAREWLEREVRLPGGAKVPELGMTISAAGSSAPLPGEFGRDPCVAFLDADRIAGPVRVRPRLPGDWFMPVGLDHRQKLKSFFINAGLARHLRDRVPVFCDDEKIIWLGGLRLDHRVRITPDTSRVWRLEIRLLKGSAA